jgi:hypothetical protein
MSTILDSGARREFGTGAVRDIAEGKGRADLLPIDIVAQLLRQDDYIYDEVLFAINQYVRHGTVQALYAAIHSFIRNHMRTDIYTAIIEVSKQYEAGAAKYAERNWEHGLPLHCFIDSAVRHYLKYRRGDTDEPHDRAVLWNLLGALWTHDHKPELIDLPFNQP